MIHLILLMSSEIQDDPFNALMHVIRMSFK